MLLRVFVVEDSKVMQAALFALFEGVGNIQVVGTASSEMEATEWLQRNRAAWDAVTLDLLLQEGSGYNLIPRFKEQNAGGGHVIVLSDFATHAVAERCLVLGADAVFTKSDVKEFAAYLGTLVAGRAGRPGARAR